MLQWPTRTVPTRRHAHVNTAHVAVAEAVVVHRLAVAVAAWKTVPAAVGSTAIEVVAAAAAFADVAAVVVAAVAAAAVVAIVVVVEQLVRNVLPYPAFRGSGRGLNCLERQVASLALLPVAPEVSNPDLLGAVLIGSAVSLVQWRYPTTASTLELALALVSALEVEPSLEVVMAVRRAMVVGLADG
jgi:hypothetical protein